MRRSFYCSRNDRLARIARKKGHYVAVRGGRMVVTITSPAPHADFRSLQVAAGGAVTVFSVDGAPFEKAKGAWL